MLGVNSRVTVKLIVLPWGGEEENQNLFPSTSYMSEKAAVQ